MIVRMEICLEIMLHKLNLFSRSILSSKTAKSSCSNYIKQLPKTLNTTRFINYVTDQEDSQ